MREKMQIVTDRLLVRRLTEDDADALFPVLSDPVVMRYIEPPFSPEQTKAFIRDAGLCEPPLVWAVLWRQTIANSVVAGSGAARQSASPVLIGHLIWHPWDESAMELGWILRRDFWGRGIAKELTAAVLERTDKDVILECSPAQTATRHIAETFGFSVTSVSPERILFRRNVVNHAF